ncbi:hypothetical protein [Senegalia massiliensis]|uniref:DUF1173 family protein n=1 Tax=Senegalia massiliensis TaxID=1720316 RepID=A0A845QZ83_9CLOT|nr:hypothetical protein [Senegalia massiliensis]NBI07621.1 hypothetical protein [Senegalia massiliensis]
MSLERSIRIEHNDESKHYSRSFLSSLTGQRLLKKLYKANTDGDEVKIFCLCKDNGIPMHMAKYSNGSTYAIRANKSLDHHKNCISSMSEKEFEERKKKRARSYNYEKDGKTFAVFNTNAFYENSIKISTPSSSKGKTSTTNVYSSIFNMGDTLLSNSWTNYVKHKGYCPKEGNLLYELYSELENNKTSKKGINLTDIMFIPRYSKDNNKDISELIKKAYFSVKYRLSEEKNIENGKLYILMKLGSKEDIQEQLDEQRGEDFIRIKVVDPFKKGYFYATVKFKKFRREFHKHKVKNAEYYISTFITFKNDKLMIDRMATIPTLKGRGFFVESSKEIEFAEYLLEREILFERPTKSSDSKHEEWNGWIPDFLILDYKTKEVTRIAEVFGFKDFWEDDEYKMKMEEKIDFFTSIQGEKIEEFIYWKANEDWSMPKLAKKTGQFIGLQYN